MVRMNCRFDVIKTLLWTQVSQMRRTTLLTSHTVHVRIVVGRQKNGLLWSLSLLCWSQFHQVRCHAGSRCC